MPYRCVFGLLLEELLAGKNTILPSWLEEKERDLSIWPICSVSCGSSWRWTAFFNQGRKNRGEGGERDANLEFGGGGELLRKS